MKSVALIIWLLAADGHESIINRSHFDDMAACEAAARAVTGQPALQGSKTHYLRHAVIPENDAVDENGNPIEDH